MIRDLPHATIRRVRPGDLVAVLAAARCWWDRPEAVPPLPRLLFEHFSTNAFVAEVEGELVGFVLGFVSQTYPGEAHVQAVAVRPDQRRAELGRALYERFFGAACDQYCSVVCAGVPADDEAALAFHRALGFSVEAPEVEPAAPSAARNDGPAERPLTRLTRAVECGPAGYGVGRLLAG
jgi:ribosomal protein S18 acetylase RimI-like enzyme